MKRLNLTFIIPLLITSCGVQPQSEDYQVSSMSDLILTQSNHPHGYGQSECFACHVKTNIHNSNALNPQSVELARRLVDQQGIASCRGCHGGNGIN